MLSNTWYFGCSDTVNTAYVPRSKAGIPQYTGSIPRTQYTVMTYVCLILGIHPAAVTAGEQVHRDGAHVLGRVLRCVGFPCAEAFPHSSAGALRVRLYVAGRCLELVQGHPRRHGVTSAGGLGRQRLPLLPLREGDSGCQLAGGGVMEVSIKSSGGVTGVSV